MVQALDPNNEEMSLKVFEMLNEFIDTKKHMRHNLGYLIARASDTALNRDYELALREQAIFFLEQVADNYPKLVVKAGLLHGILETGFKIVAEPEDGYDEDQDTPPLLALNMIYAFAVELPNKLVYPALINLIGVCRNSQQELERKAAVRVLGYVAENDACLDSVKENIDELTKLLVEKLQDPSYTVREATAETVGKFSEYVVPEFLQQHERVMPVLIKVV